MNWDGARTLRRHDKVTVTDPDTKQNFDATIVFDVKPNDKGVFLIVEGAFIICTNPEILNKKEK